MEDDVRAAERMEAAFWRGYAHLLWAAAVIGGLVWLLSGLAPEAGWLTAVVAILALVCHGVAWLWKP